MAVLLIQRGFSTLVKVPLNQCSTFCASPLEQVRAPRQPQGTIVGLAIYLCVGCVFHNVHGVGARIALEALVTDYLGDSALNGYKIGIER